MRPSISLRSLRGKKMERKQQSLLIEPSGYQEDEARSAVIEDAKRSATEKKSSKFALASLLVILFGALLVSIQPNRCLASEKPSLLNGNLTTTLIPASSTTNNTSIRITEEITTTIKAPTDEDLSTPEERTEEDLTEANLVTDKPDPEAEDSETEPSRPLGKLLVESAGQAADQLVDRLRGHHSDSGDEDSTTMAPESDRKRSADPQGSPLINSTTSFDTEQLKLAFDTYAKWRHASDDIIELFSRKLLPVIVEHGYDVDAQTVGGLLQVFNGIRTLKPWALKLLDASAKISPGILVGTQSDFGDFDECLKIRADDPSGLGVIGDLDESTGLASSTLVGKYCLADIEFPKPPRERLAVYNKELQTDFAPIELRRPLLNFNDSAAYKDTIFVETGNFFHMLYVDPLRVGICLTNKIDADNFAQVFNKLFDEFKVTINFKGRCVTKYDKVVWSLQQRISAYVIMAVCSLVLLSTGLDILHTRLHRLPGLTARSKVFHLTLSEALSKHRPLFTAFSIIRNTRRLMRPQRSSQSSIRAEGSRSLDPILSLQSNSSTSSSSSTASSPCIDRRSSLASSNINLIGNDRCDLLVANGAKKSSNLLPEIVRPSQSSASSGEQAQDGANLLCLHGIRVITMTWMIVNHTYLFGGFFVLWAHRRLIDIAEWPKSISFQLVLNGWLTVETYFFLSATIIVLNVMPLMKSKRFRYIPYIFHRLVRLLPAYSGLIALNFLWPLISSGPVWLVKGRSFIQTPCENYLWTNFLFINNWIWPEKQCMVHTWFLSADFQLYLLAPIVVYLLYRRPAFGHTVNILIAILASILSGLVIYANKLMPTTLINKLEFDSIKQQLSYSYFATYQHMGPYCLGILVGYLLHKRPHMRLPKHLTWLLWLFLPPLSFITLLLTYLWNGAYNEPQLINPSPLVSALYVAIHRTIWTSLLAWIVFTCATGRAKLMSSFLSHSMFIPLSRLSFSIYLVHLPVIMFRALNLRHTVEWTDLNILWEACGNFIASTIVGYFLNIAFESPMINLEQVIFGRPGASQQALISTDRSKGNHARARAFLQPQSDGSKLSSSDSNDQLAKSSQSAPSYLNDEQSSSTGPEVDEPTNNLSDSRQMELPEQPHSVQQLSVKHGFYPRQHRILDGIDHYSTLSHPRLPHQNSPSPRVARYATLQRHNQRLTDVEETLWPESIYQALSVNKDYKSQTRLAHQVSERRRLNRYNTLTGAGVREWRGLANDNAWSTDSHQLARGTKTQSELTPNNKLSHLQGALWPHVGLMIPRVDSSTLKRQQKPRRPSKSHECQSNTIQEESPSLVIETFKRV